MEITNKLNVPNLQDYISNLSEIKIEDLKSIGDEFLFVLRPFYWYSIMPFEDVHELVFKSASHLLKQANHADFGVTKYIGSIVTDQAINISGWVFLASSPEIASSVDLSEMAKTADGEAKELFLSLAKKMKDLEGAKHKANQIIQEVGQDNLPLISQLIHEMMPDDQSFVLHAMRFGPDPVKAKEFFLDFVSKTKNSNLKEEALENIEKLD